MARDHESCQDSGTDKPLTAANMSTVPLQEPHTKPQHEIMGIRLHHMQLANQTAICADTHKHMDSIIATYSH